MIDFDSLVADCIAANAEDEPRLAVRQVLERFVAGGPAPNQSDAPAPGITLLYNSPTLTVLNVVWPPLISLFPHDHQMWAAIGIYGGQEDNTFYRREGGRIVASGGKELRERDVALLGAETIHAVRNPFTKYTGAIHVYGGDFIAQPRSQWDACTLAEAPYDHEAVRLAFERAEQEYEAQVASPSVASRT